MEPSATFKGAPSHQDFLVMLEDTIKPNSPVSPFFDVFDYNWRSRRFKGDTGIERLNQLGFPLEPLDLPRPETSQHKEGWDGEQSWPEGWSKAASGRHSRFGPY
jgi:hypothetical protein